MNACEAMYKNGMNMRDEKKEYIKPTIDKKAIYHPGNYMGLGKNPGGPLYFNRCKSRWEQEK